MRGAVILERGGKVLGSTLVDDERAQQVATEAAELLRDAESRHRHEGEARGEFAQLESSADIVMIGKRDHIEAGPLRGVEDLLDRRETVAQIAMHVQVRSTHFA